MSVAVGALRQKLERSFEIRRFAVTSYAYAEAFYDLRQNTYTGGNIVVLNDAQ